MKIYPASTPLAAILFLGSFAGLLAQTAPTATPDETVKLSPFTVSAEKDAGYRATNSIGGTKINTPLRDIPLNIQVVTEDFIKDIGAIDGTEALKYQAGVEIRDRDGANYTSFRIRGYNVNWQFREGFRRYDINDATNIDRIEVVAGPAAVFYGFSQPGGLINTFNKRPTGQNTAELSYSHGTWNYNRAEVDANVAVNGKLAMRFSSSYTYQDSSWRDWDYLNRRVFAPVIAYQFTDDTKLTLDYEHLQQEIGFTTNKIQDAFIDPITGARTLLNRYLDIDRSRQWSGPDTVNTTGIDNFIASVDHRFADWLSMNAAVNLYGHTQVRRSDVQRGIQVDALRDRNGNLVRDSNGNTIRAIRTWWCDDPQANTVYNARVDFLGTYNAAGIKNKFLVGASTTFDINPREELRDGDTSTSSAGRIYRYYALTDLNPDLRKYNNSQFNAPLYTSVAQSYRDTQDFKSYYFNYMGSMWDEKINVLAGIRHDDFTYNRRRRDGAVGNAFDQNQQQWSPQLGIVVRPIPALSFYGLKNSSLEVPPVQTNSIGEVLPNREGRSTEYGLKYDLLDGRLSGILAVYTIKNKNIAINDPSVPRKLDGLPGESVTVGEQTSEGVDYNVMYSPFKGYQLVAGWSYNDTYVSKDVNPARIGQRFDILPYNRATFWNNYSFRDGSLKGLSVGFGTKWTDKMDRGTGSTWRVDLTDPNSPIIKNSAFWVWDAAVRYGTKIKGYDTTFSLNVLNLLDQKDQGGGIWIEPRNVRFTVGMKF